MSPSRRNQPDGPGPDGSSVSDRAAPVDGGEAAAGSGSGTALSAAAVDAGNTTLLALIDRLAGMLDRSELTELEIQVGETAVVLRKHAAVAPPLVAPPAAAVAASVGPGSDAPATSSVVTRPSVKAPLTGIWYGSPSPGTAAYVTPGGEVAAGQVIGLIEAMKLFNEIKSDLSGRVVKVHAEDGKLVKAKQPLIEVDPL